MGLKFAGDNWAKGCEGWIGGREAELAGEEGIEYGAEDRVGCIGGRRRPASYSPSPLMSR